MNELTGETQDAAAQGVAPLFAPVRAAPPRPVATLAMMAVNVAIFALMAWRNGGPEFSGEYVLAWGADYAPLTLGGGQVWRLASSTFLHFGLMHIASNMYCLWVWGGVTERVLGPRRWVAAYLGMGLAASLASVLLNRDVVSAGASGAISGLLGIMLMMRLMNYRLVSTRTIAVNLLLNIGIAIAVPVDWIAHLGGFVAGIAVGAVWLRRQAL
jgi:rhomboid protease GluP